MNNLKKVGLTALAGALVSVSANAADLSVTGGASLNFAGEEKKDTGNGWTMTNGVTFSASVEQDNGWNITVKQVLNDDDVASDRVFDTRVLTIDMGDSGTLSFTGTGGSSVIDSLDDVTPTAGEESWDDVTGADTSRVTGSGNDDMFNYSNSSMMDGLTINASYVPSDSSGAVEGSEEYGFAYTGVEGLTIGAATGDDNGTSTTIENSAMYVTYAFDAFSVGYQANEADSEAANADKDFTAIGVSYAVSDEMSISLNQSEIEFEDSTKSDQEATGISVSYTMGSMTIKANHNSVDNIAGTATDDRSGYALSLGFTF
jgi:outer membrane protein OmpU